jgi:hypothetical protein
MEIKGADRRHYTGKVIVLTADGIVESTLALSGKTISLDLAPSSFTIVRIAASK